MPRREWEDRVEDILEAITKIQDYTKGMDQPTFLVDTKTVEAVIFNLTIIGEAVNHIPDEVQKRTPKVPWHLMRGIRNVLIHEYFKISKNILWDTISLELPKLIGPLKSLI